MAFDIDAALRYVVEREGSDLHVKVASPPMARVHGALKPIEDSESLSEEEAKFLVHAGQTDKLDESGQPVKAADGSAVKVPIEYCTDLVRPNTQAALTMKFIEPGTYDFEAQDAGHGPVVAADRTTYPSVTTITPLITAS